MNFRRLTNGIMPPKNFGVMFLVLAIIFAFGQTAFGLTVTAPVDTLPIGASVNDFDGDHHFMVAFELSLLAADLTWADDDEIVITCPSGVRVADTDGDLDFDNEVGISWGATNDLAIIAGSISATGGASSAVTVAIPAASSAGVSDGDLITIYFPVTTSPSLADGDTASFTILLDDLDDGASDLTQLVHVTFRDNMNLVKFDANYTGGNDSTDTDGDIFPDGGAAAITLALPDLITDQAVGNDGAVADGADWTQLTSDGDASTALDNDDATTDEVTFTLWASKYDTVTKISGAVAEVVVALDNATSNQIADYEDGTMSYALDASQLDEGEWYFYVTSSATADWVLGMSDAVKIRHHPFFTDDDNDATGIDFDGDEVYEPGNGLDDDVSLIVLDVSGGLGTNGEIGTTSAQDVDFYVSVNDYDDEATFHVFRVPTSVTPTADSIKFSGTYPNLTVTGLGGGTAITAQPVLAELPYSIVNYSAIRSSTDYDPVGDYNIWVVANDGKHQAIQKMKSNEVGGSDDLELTISTFPKFNFVSNGDETVNTATQEYLLINWGRTVDMDNDVDGTMIIKLYASDLIWGAGTSGATITPANVDTTLLPADAVLDPTHTVHIATIVDTSDTQQANRYMWNVRESGLAAGTYWIYAIITSGPDAAIVRMNDRENMAENADGGGTHIDVLTINHGSYFISESPIEGEVANLGDGDTYQLKWTAFDKDAVATDLTVGAFMVAEGTDLDTDESGVVEFDEVTNVCYWLTTATDGSAVIVYGNAPQYSDGRYIVDAGDITDNANGDGDPLGTFDVYYVYDDDNDANDAWDVGSATVVKADGQLYFSNETDKNSTYNFRMEPTQIVMEKGDTLTISVYASDANPGGGNDVMWLETYLNVPSEFYGIVDQNTGTAVIEGFTPNVANFAGVTTKNIAADSSDHYELDLIRHASDLATETDLNDEVVATFQIYAKTDAVSEALESAAITFNTTGERICRMFDADFTQLTANVPSSASVLSITPRGKITGLIDVEGRSDSSQTVQVWVCPTGSFDSITDASFVAANGDSDVSDGITVTLDANGRFTLTSVPTGVYDILVSKTGWLSQQATSVTVQAYSTTTVNFYNADRLLAGDCAGYDDDGDGVNGTITLPDNQIGSTDHSVFEAGFEATPADTNWNVYCDIDADGEITINDIHYSAVNANPGTGEGIQYKRQATDGAETLAKLVILKKDKGSVTYGVVAENFPAMQAYSVKVFIDGKEWDIVSYEDKLHSDRKLFFDSVEGYYHNFVCAAIGNIGSKEMSPLMATITVSAKVANAADPEIRKVMLVDVYHRLNNPTIVNSIENDGNALPTEFSLSKNYPNPFNPTTTINFALPKAGNVTLDVYNMLGQKVRTLVSTKMAAGNFKAMWDAKNDFGMRVSSGVYFYRLQVDSKVIGTEKMLLLK